MSKKEGKKKTLLTVGILLAIVFFVLKIIAIKKKSDEAKDEELKKDSYKGAGTKVSGTEPTFYASILKPMLDKVLSFFALILLSPLFAIISLAIVIDDPGPVLFTQKRVGVDKTFFKLHKFRSMKMCTPHDTPTHLLENPEQYITRVGKFLRKSSLDELPQIWDIFMGNLSIVGPRPALWNQYDLVDERDKYGANDVLPGLTGWAQINGRDELEIPVKAKLDGEYCKALRVGNLDGFLMDAKCFLGTFISVAKAEGVVEGGTGAKKEDIAVVKSFRGYTEGKSDEELIGNIGFGESVSPDFSSKKRVLITGEGSYIGESFRTFAEKNYKENFDIETLDMLCPDWENKSFNGYDIVYHVAGLAHADVGNVSEETKENYYRVNTDLAIKVAKKAKQDGVKEFIFMSSMIIYGDSAPYGTAKLIDEKTVPKAANFYGDSKLQADVAIRELADGDFKVVVLRPPMIYGKGSKGNYPLLSKLAGILPFFPTVNNERSMLHIDNLCEFLVRVMLVRFTKDSVVLIPQNAEWTNTCDMVEMIAKAKNKKMFRLSVLNPGVKLGSLIPGKIGGLVNKAFGNATYAHEISRYEGIPYQFTSLQSSVLKTELEADADENESNTLKEDNSVCEPLVSIITVSYNSEKTIRKTIESVLNQTYPKLEYRIVDGLSSDNTVKIAMEYASAFKEKGVDFVVTSERDRGIYDAMNKGIYDANGTIIGIINSDDYYEPNAVETMVSTYIKTGFDYYFADINLVKEDGTVIVKHSKADKIVTSRHWNHPTSFVTKETYEELGAFKCEGIHDDFDFYLRVRKAGLKVVIENKILANFSVGGVSNDKSFDKCKKRCMDRFKCYANNGYSPLYIVECVAIEVAKYIIS